MANKNAGNTKYDPKGVDQFNDKNNASGKPAAGAGNTDTTGKVTREQPRRTKRTVEQGWPELVTADLVDIELPDPDENIEVEHKQKHTRRKSKKAKRTPSRVKTPAGVVMIQHTDDVARLIKTGFELIAGRVGDLWAVSDEEALSIATPLCKILAKYEQSKMVAENMDAVALIVATGTILVPRIILQRELVKNARAVEGGKNNEGTFSRETRRTDEKHQQSEHQTDDISPIKQIIPPLPD